MFPGFPRYWLFFHQFYALMLTQSKEQEAWVYCLVLLMCMFLSLYQRIPLEVANERGHVKIAKLLSSLNVSI